MIRSAGDSDSTPHRGLRSSNKARADHDRCQLSIKAVPSPNGLNRAARSSDELSAKTVAPGRPERRYDLDWLRVIGVLLIVAFHVTEMFDPLTFHYIRGEPNAVAMAINFFALQWIMPLFFLLAGVSSWFALETRTAAQYVTDRTERLLAPLVFGTIILVPIMSYFRLLQSAVFTGSYVEFYQVYFFSYITQEGWAHLWFLAYLLVFSLIALPLFVALKRPRGRRLVDQITRRLRVGGILLLLPVPLVVIEVTLRARYPFGMPTLISDWASFLSFTTFFIYGYLIMSNRLVQEAVKRVRFVALGAGIATAAGRFALGWTGNLPTPDYSLNWSLYMTLNAFDSWFWITTILGLAFKHLNFNTKALGYLNDIVVPIYILHLPVAVIIAFYVVAWPTLTVVKALVILGGTLAMTLGLCEVCVKRTRVTRFILGMRSRRPVPTA